MIQVQNKWSTISTRYVQIAINSHNSRYLIFNFFFLTTLSIIDVQYDINKFQYDIFARVKLNEILISFLRRGR